MWVLIQNLFISSGKKYYIQSAIHRNLSFLKNKSEHLLYESTSTSFVYSPLGGTGDLAADCIYPSMVHLL